MAIALPSLYDLFVVAAASAVATFVIFPIVFLMSFYYSGLVKSNQKTPKILLMLLCTFFGVLIAAAILYLYVKYSFLPQAAPMFG